MTSYTVKYSYFAHLRIEAELRDEIGSDCWAIRVIYKSGKTVDLYNEVSDIGSTQDPIRKTLMSNPAFLVDLMWAGCAIHLRMCGGNLELVYTTSAMDKYQCVEYFREAVGSS